MEKIVGPIGPILFLISIDLRTIISFDLKLTLLTKLQQKFQRPLNIDSDMSTDFLMLYFF